MGRQHEHEKNHQHEREHKKDERKQGEHAQEGQVRTIHPAWFVMLGIVLIVAVVTLWTVM